MRFLFALFTESPRVVTPTAGNFGPGAPIPVAPVTGGSRAPNDRRRQHKFEGKKLLAAAAVLLPHYSPRFGSSLFTITPSLSLTLTHTLVLSLSLSRSRSRSATSVRRFSVSGHLREVGNSSIYNTLPTACRQLCVLSSPSDNNGSYFIRNNKQQTKQLQCSTP